MKRHVHRGHVKWIVSAIWHRAITLSQKKWFVLFWMCDFIALTRCCKLISFLHLITVYKSCRVAYRFGLLIAACLLVCGIMCTGVCEEGGGTCKVCRRATGKLRCSVSQDGNWGAFWGCVWRTLRTVSDRLLLSVLLILLCLVEVPRRQRAAPPLFRPGNPALWEPSHSHPILL